MQQAMLISAMALIDPGDTAWIEDPGFHQALRTFILPAQPWCEADRLEGIVIGRSFSQYRRPFCIASIPARDNNESGAPEGSD